MAKLHSYMCSDVSIGRLRELDVDLAVKGLSSVTDLRNVRWKHYTEVKCDLYYAMLYPKA